MGGVLGREVCIVFMVIGGCGWDFLGWKGLESGGEERGWM